jgi:hydrogenase nickel insertion protein HypA
LGFYSPDAITATISGRNAMHEFSIASQIADNIKEHAKGKKIEKINIQIGSLSGVFKESLEFYLQSLLKEFQSEEPVFHFTPVSASMTCECGFQFIAENLLNACPKCRGFKRSITAGKDCFVESIEVSEE